MAIVASRLIQRAMRRIWRKSEPLRWEDVFERPMTIVFIERERGESREEFEARRKAWVRP